MYKVTIIGQPSTGKSSILRRINKGTFEEHTESTIGSSHINYSKSKTIDDRTIRLSIWDTAGQEQFCSLIPFYIRDSKAIIIVYDSNNTETYNKVINYWFPYVISNMKQSGKCLYYLVANKIDIPKHNIEIPEESLWESFKVSKHKTSAKLDIGIKDLFDKICNDLDNDIEINNDIKNKESHQNTLKLSNNNQDGNVWINCCGP